MSRRSGKSFKVPPAPFPKRAKPKRARKGELSVNYVTLDREGKRAKKQSTIELLKLTPMDGYSLPADLLVPHTFIHVVRSRKHDPADSVYYLLGTGTYKPTGISEAALEEVGIAYDVRNNSPIINEPWLKRQLGEGEPTRFFHIKREDGKPPRTLGDKHSFVHLNHYSHDRENDEHRYYTLGEVEFVLPLKNMK